MTYNKVQFKNFSEFKAVQKLAFENGCKTQEDFDKYLKQNYSK